MTLNVLKRIENLFIDTSEEDVRISLLETLPKKSICAEIGVWKGDFTRKILKHVNPCELHLIDPWKYQTEYGERLFGGKVAKKQQDMDAIFKKVLRTFAKDSRVTIHRGFSEKAVEKFDVEYFDWIYIDGNHYYEFVKADLEMYLPKIKKGGLMTGDDYYWTSPELSGERPVERAVKEFIDENNVELIEVINEQFIIKKL